MPSTNRDSPRRTDTKTTDSTADKQTEDDGKTARNSSTSPSDDGSRYPNDPFTGADDNLCPCYEEELANARKKLDEETFEILDIPTVKCGHAIHYLVENTGTTITVSTARSYATYLRRYVAFLHNSGLIVTEAKFENVEKLMRGLARLQRGKETLTGYRTGITELYKYIRLYRDVEVNVKWDLIREEINPSDYQTGKSFEREPLDVDEVKKLYEALNSFRNRLMAQVGVELGPRNGSLRDIKTEDVDLDEQEIELKNIKSGGTYTLPITDELTLLLRRWIATERVAQTGADQCDYLFPSLQGGKLSSVALRGIIKNAAEDAGIQETVTSDAILTQKEKETLGTGKDHVERHKVTPHTLRHTFCNLLKEAGIPVEARSEAMDHGSTEVTEEHYDVNDTNYKDLIKELFSGVSDLSGDEENNGKSG